MDRVTFQQRFKIAADGAIVWARQHVINTLPDIYLFLLHPNQSYDGNPLVRDEEIYPKDSLASRGYLGPLPIDEAIEYLWRNGKIPEWIDVSVQACDEKYTYLQLLCCGRYTEMDELLYHQREGYPPFHVLSPNIPPGWENLEESGKFDIYWHGTDPLTAA